MRGLLSKTSSEERSRRDLVLLDDTSPWLVDRRPRRVGRCMMGLGLSLVLVGAIGGATTMQAWAASTLCIGGCLTTVAGVVGWCASLATPVRQVCPECLTSMRRGATRCPACHYHA